MATLLDLIEGVTGKTPATSSGGGVTLDQFVSRINSLKQAAANTTQQSAYDALKQFASPVGGTTVAVYTGDEIPPRPYTPQPTGKVYVDMPTTEATPGSSGFTLDQLASYVNSLKQQAATNPPQQSAYDALKQFASPVGGTTVAVYTGDEIPPRPYTPQPTGKVAVGTTTAAQQGSPQAQYYTIWYQGQPYYADPASGVVYDSKGNDIGYRAVYNAQTGQWELRSSVGTLYVGADGTVYDASGNAVAYVDLNNPSGTIGGQGFSDYLRFMMDTGRVQGIYQAGPSQQQAAAGGTAAGGSNPALEELYKLIMQTFTSQSTNWENTLNALLQSLGTSAGQLAQIGTPAFYQQLYNTAWQALQQPMAQSREALRQAYMANIPGVLDALAGAGVINSTTGAQALAALAAQYLGALAQQQAQWAQVAPQYMQAGTGAAEQQTRQALAMPSTLLSTLQALPGSGLSAVQQLIGLFDLLGRTFV